MIAALRRRHRRVVGVLAPVALGFLGLALADRPPEPRAVTLPGFAVRVPGAEAVGRPGEGALLWEREDLLPGLPARLSARRVRGRAVALDVKLLRPLVRPDVLLYWTPETGLAATGLPDDAHLLGRIAGTTVRRYALPAHGVPRTEGAIVLYSLGHQEVVARAVLPSIAGGGVAR